MKLNPEQIKNIYFVGAGGIGMAALERYFLSKGKNVAGYDLTPSELTEALQNEGVEMTFTADPDTIPTAFRDSADTLVVYTPAVPNDLPILEWFRSAGHEIVKRAELLGVVTRSSKSLCFAGTHGKTTTSSMAAHILHCGDGCNAFLGGVLKNYNSNFLLDAFSPYTVIEADEFDRSFHHLSPTVAVITATDPDHLDIYGTEEAYLEAFAKFTELIRPGGTLILHEGLKLKPRPGDDVRVLTYSRDKGDFHASYIRRDQGVITFDIVTPLGTIRNVNLGVPVEINIENAIAAVAAVCSVGNNFDAETIRTAISSYGGIKRRFETWLREPGPDGRVIIDDYAHHPQEIKTAIASVRALYPGRRLTVAFQPHLYTRTRDFAPEFAAALDEADSVILIDLYPAREQPIEGISTATIASLMKNEDILMIPKEKLAESLKNRNFDILLTMGAGDMVNELPEIVRTVTSD